MKRSSKLLTFLRRLPPYLVLALVVAAAGPYCAAQADKAGAPAPGGTARPEADKADATPPSMSMLELFERGGWFMLPIVLASLVGLALIIERLISLRKDKIIPPRLLDQLKDTYKPGQEDRSAGLNYCHANASPLARVLAAGIGKMHRDEQTVEQAIEDAGANEIAKLKRNLRGLFAVGTALEVDALDAAGVAKADVFIAATNGDNTNIVIAQIAQRKYGVKTVIARILDPLRAEWYSTQGLRTICPTKVAVEMLETEIRVAVAGEA